LRLAAGFLLLFIIGWLLFPAKSNKVESANVLPPVAEKTIDPILQNTNTNKIPLNPSSQKTTDKVPKNAQLKSPVNRPNSPNQNTDVNNAGITQLTPVTKRNPIPNEPYKASATIDPPTQSITEDPARAEAANSIFAGQSNSTTVNEIHTLAFQISANEENYVPKAGVQLPKGSKPRKVDMLVYAKGQSRNMASLNGYEAGLALEKRIGKSKWSMVLGGAFQSEIRQLKFQTNSFINETFADSSVPISLVVVDPEANFNLDSMDEITGYPTNGFAGSNQFSSNSNLNVQLNYVAFPLAASYQLTPRFGIQAGITPSIFLFGKITTKDNYAEVGRSFEQDAINTNASASKRSYPIQNNRYFYFTSKAIAPAAIKRFKFPVHLGLDYQVNRHLSISLDYQYTPFRIIDKDFVSTNNQRVRLGAGWKF
jgi:opacity protein-like surface antigen